MEANARSGWRECISGYEVFLEPDNAVLMIHFDDAEVRAFFLAISIARRSHQPLFSL